MAFQTCKAINLSLQRTYSQVGRNNSTYVSDSSSLRKVVNSKNKSMHLFRTYASSTEVDTVADAEVLKALKDENMALRMDLRSALGELINLGGMNTEALDLLTSLERSMAEVSEEINWPSPNDEVPFWERSARKQGYPAMLPPVVPVQKDDRTMNIVHISAELAPIAKVGGLGDAVAGLAKACHERGHTVECMLPFYTVINEDEIKGFQHDMSLNSWFKGGNIKADVYRGTVDDVPVVLIRPENHYFDGNIYGGSYNEMEAYLYFSRACLEYLKQTQRNPDVIHFHDWHTSAIPLLYWDMYHAMGLNKAKLFLTIHNMDNTGEVKVEELDWVGLNGIEYCVPEKAMDPRTKGHNPERMALLKGGIVYSTATTTVSPSYAAEVMQGSACGWMQECLDLHKDKFHGLLNGIDRNVWDPVRDAVLPMSFSAASPAGKTLCKQFVMRGLGMAEEGQEEEMNSKPLVVCVSRLVPQKGIHLIKRAIYRTAEQGGAFVLLGTANMGGITAEFEAIREEFKDNKDIQLLLMYSEQLSHHLYAAADMVLVPSMFEPCGLTQMVGMQYGALPIVRRTGGLGDTVFDVDSDADRKNGFVFDGTDEPSLDSALDRAIQYYKEKPEWWKTISVSNMTIDNTWNTSASKYIDLYQK